MHKKANMFTLASIIAVAVGFFVILQYEGSVNIADLSTLASTQRYAEQLKTFGYHALEHAGTITSQKFANQSLYPLNKGYWMSYAQPIVAPPETVAAELADRTKDLCNIYLKQLEGEQYGDIIFYKIGELGSVTVLIKSENVLKGEHDENYGVLGQSSAPSEIVYRLATGEETVNIFNQYQTAIINWRFWYLYRTIREWAISNVLSENTCSIMPAVTVTGRDTTCKVPEVQEDQVALMINRSMGKLQASFDEYVDCNYTALCNYANTIPYINDEPCEDFQSAVDPGVTCPANCLGTVDCSYDTLFTPCLSGACEDSYCGTIEGYDAPPCTRGEVSFYGPRWDPEDSLGAVHHGSCFAMGEKHIVSFTAEITCEDAKHLKPIGEKGFEKLSMKALMHVYLTHEARPPTACVKRECMGTSSSPGQGSGSGSGGGTPPLPSPSSPPTPPSPSSGSGSGSPGPSSPSPSSGNPGPIGSPEPPPPPPGGDTGPPPGGPPPTH